MNFKGPLFVTGIGTGIGKTVVSSILVRALGADYWKPVQAGDLDNSDSAAVRLAGNGPGVIHPERYLLDAPISPHASAALQGLSITLDSFSLPQSERPLVIEGAGGVLTPLSDEVLMIDLIEKLQVPAIVVARVYLGCINHSLLTLESLARRGIPVAGVVFNGDFPAASIDAILGFSGAALLGQINEEASIDAEIIGGYAERFARNLSQAELVH